MKIYHNFEEAYGVWIMSLQIDERDWSPNLMNESVWILIIWTYSRNDEATVVTKISNLNIWLC